ncbi:hypothetical protein SESBI_29015 [Sesbania bispinosa]|nr:hypothetical protein SESBI_29015 [Sesbania bispinosa]
MLTGEGQDGANADETWAADGGKAATTAQRMETELVRTETELEQTETELQWMTTDLDRDRVDGADATPRSCIDGDRAGRMTDLEHGRQRRRHGGPKVAEGQSC